MNTNLKRDNLLQKIYQLWSFHPFISCLVFYWNVLIPGEGGRGGGAGLPYISDGDARQNFSKETPKSHYIGCGSSQYFFS